MKAVVFSGTSEGREISLYLNNKKIESKVFVATEYGKAVMEEMSYISISVGRLDKEKMEKAVEGADFVIDATHPFACEVTKNIKFVCGKMKIKYIRLLRDDGIKDRNGIISVKNIQAAVRVLKNTDGNIFVSTGAKELDKYCEIENYKKRIAVRVLPILESKEKCISLGIENVIYKKGPFSYFENTEDFKRHNIKWLVTKNSGKKGGFDEKINAARDLGINIIVVERPEEDGLSVEEVKNFIDEQYES